MLCPHLQAPAWQSFYFISLSSRSFMLTLQRWTLPSRWASELGPSSHLRATKEEDDTFDEGPLLLRR